MIKFFLCFLIGVSAQAKNVEVTMKSISFEPQTLTIKAGDSVSWVNASMTEHSATADDGTFDTKLVEPKKNSKPIEFAHKGTYLYHCSVHGKTMHATINVE